MPAASSAADVLPDDTSSTPSSCRPLREVDQSGLVVDREQRTFDLRSHAFMLRLHEPFDHVGIQAALHFLDAFVQGLLGVAVEDGDRLLGEDRPGVDVLGDEVHGRSRHLHPELERVAHRVPTLERRQERGMGVDRPAAVGVDERLRQDRAEAGDGDEVDVVAVQHVDDVVRVGDPVEARAEVGALDELGRDAVRRGRCRGRRTAGRRPRRRSGSCRSSRASRMVPLPDARTPTRMLRHPIPRRRWRLRAEIPRSRPERCFTSLYTEGEDPWLIGNRPRPARSRSWPPARSMLIFSFLHFAGGHERVGQRQLFPIATLLPLYGLVMALQIALTKFAVGQAARLGARLHLGADPPGARRRWPRSWRSAGCSPTTGDKQIGQWFEILGGIALVVGAVLLQRERNTGAIG